MSYVPVYTYQGGVWQTLVQPVAGGPLLGVSSFYFPNATPEWLHDTYGQNSYPVPVSAPEQTVWRPWENDSTSTFADHDEVATSPDKQPVDASDNSVLDQSTANTYFPVIENASTPIRQRTVDSPHGLLAPQRMKKNQHKVGSFKSFEAMNRVILRSGVVWRKLKKPYYRCHKEVYECKNTHCDYRMQSFDDGFDFALYKIGEHTCGFDGNTDSACHNESIKRHASNSIGEAAEHIKEVKIEISEMDEWNDEPYRSITETDGNTVEVEQSMSDLTVQSAELVENVKVEVQEMDHSYGESRSITETNGNNSTAAETKKWRLVGRFDNFDAMDQRLGSDLDVLPTYYYKEKADGTKVAHFKCYSCSYQMMTMQKGSRFALYEAGEHDRQIQHHGARRTLAVRTTEHSESSESSVWSNTDTTSESPVLDNEPVNNPIHDLKQVASEFNLLFNVDRATGKFIFRDDVRCLEFESQSDLNQITLVYSVVGKRFRLTESWASTVWNTDLAIIRKKVQEIFEY